MWELFKSTISTMWWYLLKHIFLNAWEAWNELLDINSPITWLTLKHMYYYYMRLLTSQKHTQNNFLDLGCPERGVKGPPRSIGHLDTLRARITLVHCLLTFVLRSFLRPRGQALISEGILYKLEKSITFEKSKILACTQSPECYTDGEKRVSLCSGIYIDSF